MAFLLRVISRAKWVKPQWIETDDIPADALSDLRSDNNELSVWNVQSDRSNLESVLVAIASSRLRLDKLDYALLDEQLLPQLSIKCIRSNGNTPHPAANGTMHRDLIELTVQKIATLAGAMMPLERTRVPEKRIKEMLISAIENSVLDRDRIDPRLLSDLAPVSS